MVNIKTLSIKYKILIIFIILLVLGALYFFLVHSKNNNESNTPYTQPVGLINLNPPTEQEKVSGDAAKQKAIEDEQRRNTPRTTESGKVVVKPSITYSSQYGESVEVGAFVPGVFEEGGKCTLTLTKDGAKAISSVNAVRGANSVDCPVMIIGRSQLALGTWQAVVSYYSSSASGVSEARSVEVK